PNSNKRISGYRSTSAPGCRKRVGARNARDSSATASSTHSDFLVKRTAWRTARYSRFLQCAATACSHSALFANLWIGSGREGDHLNKLRLRSHDSVIAACLIPLAPAGCWKKPGSIPDLFLEVMR